MDDMNKNKLKKFIGDKIKSAGIDPEAAEVMADLYGDSEHAQTWLDGKGIVQAAGKCSNGFAPGGDALL